MTTTDTLLNRVFDGRYVIRRRLGSGGMADVYLAEDQVLKRRVALKMLNDRHASDEQFVERFRREAQSAAGLNHHNIVSIFDRGHAEGTYYIAMEFLDGRTLKELLVRNGPTPVPIALDYARQILDALSFAHRNGIVYRDIKPHNIVVGPDGRLKVTDFGIARSGASVDPRSDLYALGIVVYEMLTGTVPYTGDTPVEIAMKHLSAIPKPPSELRPDIPHDLDAVVMRALAKDPDQRYASAEEMDADLARVARGVAVSQKTEDAMTQVLSGAGATATATMVTRPRVVTPPAPPAYRPPTSYYDYEEPPPSRRIWPWLLVLLALVAAGVGGWFLYDRIQDELTANRPVAVPYVQLLPEDLARQKIEAVGLKVRLRHRTSPTTPRGTVIEQSPQPGDRIARDSTVTIWVSTGKPQATVPDVKGHPLTDAIAQLASAGLRPNIVYIFSTALENTVIAQNPTAGDRVLRGSRVRVNVSRG